ncbi:polymeric immunoglobulin receptor [Melopsittacus undulatus]|uniref:polymeric immunoglobulin receptor n=1 Tax=Melopsittacus undulatus TaxID=13146 RepID=UPI00146CA046|nr:polymeric immunoglobulin receptor [Melopsittacus undulatus]
MISLAFILLLAFLSAESARSRYPPKSSSSPVFGPQQVYGLLNGSVTVTCFYPPTRVNRHDRKYWCKETVRGCFTVTSTTGYTAPHYQGRASITDNPQEENFQISFSKLTMEDTGTYQCGIGVNNRRLSHKVNLDVSQDSHIPEGAELFYVKLHSTLTMTCSFGSDYDSERKFLCKMGKTGCIDIIDSYGKVDEDYTGRALLSNTLDPGSFSIMITQMSWEDSGLYLCGVGVYGKNGETKELDVHVYEETSVPQGKPTVFGVKGSSATFECRYKPREHSSVSYWCKWRQNGCYRIIDNTGYVSGLYEGRVVMYDNPDNQTITIILNQLKDSDEGYYWCMTDEEEEQKSSTELKIVEGEPALQGKKDIEAQEGSQLNLTCSYPCRYYSYQKYWCKWSSTSCTPLLASDQRQPGPGVTCDTDDKTVILSFDSVAKSDQGWYWCGVKRNGLYGETMAVYLSVTAGGSAGHSLESLDADVPSIPEEAPQGRANNAASESPNQSGPNILLLVLAPVGAALLIIVTAFAVFKYRQMKRSDLVSVGSYRTNISMSDFESVKDYGASNNACVKETQETRMGGDEFVTTAATPEGAAETKKAKRSSKEDADLAYSAFLLTSGSIVQGSSGGDAAAPDVSPHI